VEHHPLGSGRGRLSGANSRGISKRKRRNWLGLMTAAMENVGRGGDVPPEPARWWR
jgi:truncated hemoglobin YjbI